MKKKFKFIIATGMVLAMTTMAAFGQVSKYASAGTILDDVDYSKDYMYFKDANIKDFIVSGEISTNNLNANFGKQFSSVYWNFGYSGNLWGNNQSTDTKEGETKTSTKDKYNYANYFKTFVGFRNFSIGSSFSFAGNKDYTETYSKTEPSSELSPSLFLSGDINLDTMVIKPFLEFNYNNLKFDFVEDAIKRSTESNLFKIYGGTDLVTTKENYKSIWKIQYDGKFGTSKTVTTKNSTPISESKPFDNHVTISYKFLKNLTPKLVLGVNASLLNQFDFNKEYTNLNKENTDTFTYRLNPTVAIGVRYELVESKLSLLLGSSMTVFPISVKTTKTTSSSKDEKKTVFTTDDFSSNFTLGLDWNITNNFALDCKSYIPTTNVNTLGNMQFALGVSYRK